MTSNERTLWPRTRMALFIPPRESRGTARSAVREPRASTMILSTPIKLNRRRPLHHAELSSGRPLRAGPVGTVPLPRYRGAENKFVLAARLRPSFCITTKQERNNFFRFASRKQGGGAPKGAPSIGRIAADKSRSVRNRLLMRQRLVREPLAFRRSAAALAGASERSSSAQAALHAIKRMQALPAPSIALKPGTWRPGHNAGGVDARAARERVTSPPAGTALAPSNGCHR